MCGIAGIVSLDGQPIPNLRQKLGVMSGLIEHRGPDGRGSWLAPDGRCGLAHQRLSVIDLTESGAQPMAGENGTIVTYNGEIYNYQELRDEFAPHWSFKSRSDTETILAGYAQESNDCVEKLRGMFAFALWDEKNKRLFCARDHFGIKPFHYLVSGRLFVFASEIKALMPFLPEVQTNSEALAEYLTFQFTIGDQTLFEGVKTLSPGHTLTVNGHNIRVQRYWDINYEIDLGHDPGFFNERVRELLYDSVGLHLRSDVPIGTYLSGGIDSSLITILAAQNSDQKQKSFHGKFSSPPGYDESRYAELVTSEAGNELLTRDITATDFEQHINDVIYALDFPVAGPGSFPQYIVSKMASEHVKVVLGGQGGDEIFGGYARYLLAYFEQCIKAAIDGTYKDGNFVVTIESIVPNLGMLREYKPLIQKFWQEGLFDQIDARYFRLIDRAADIGEEIDWGLLDQAAVYERFRSIFNNSANVREEAYFDKMTHFDFKCLLPALLHVEDRMSMAHGLESRVPLLDHPLVEFTATVPATVKFPGGRMKQLITTAFEHELPTPIRQRRDKMGFPVPLSEWFEGPLKDMVMDTFTSRRARERGFIRPDAVIASLEASGQFSRKTWGLLSLELWHQLFHDQAATYRAMIN